MTGPTLTQNDPPARPKPTVGSLFAGYEGIGLALKDVFDAEPIWFSEFDKAPTAILAHHYPGVPNLGDITKIDWSAVARPDILTGGSPCQDMSSGGKGAGMKEGTRSGLWSYMRDAIAALQPELVVWENVRGALSADADSDMEPCAGCVGGKHPERPLRALGRVLSDLADIGYDAAWCGLRAADIGAPHDRFRIFVLAWPTANTESLGRERAGDAWVGGNGSSDSSVAPAGRVVLLPTPTTQPTTGNGHARNLGGELRVLPTPTVTGAHGNGYNGRGEPLLPGIVDFGAYSPAIERWVAITRPAPAPRESSGKNGAARLSPKFVEWMQGLPAGWVTDVGISRGDQLKALGNGVVPQQCAAAVRYLLGVRADALRMAA